MSSRSRLGFPGLLRLLIALAGLAPWLFLLLKEQGLIFQPAFHVFCHQLPERTLEVCGTSMLVCSRCAGIYGGIALGAMLPAFGFMVRRGRLVFLISLGAMLLDVLTQDAGLHPLNHALRLATGLMVGWSASAFLFASLEKARS